MTLLWVAACAAAVAVCFWIAHRIRQRHVLLWWPAYVKRDWAGRRESAPPADAGPVHVIFCVTDHFEPAWLAPGIEVERRRVAHWVQEYPEVMAGFRDADGRPPRHTFFFPAEAHRAEHLERMRELVKAGYAEVEVHLHHDGDTSAGVRDTLLEFVERLSGHGYLGAHKGDGRKRFGFVHGNWALDNSAPGGRWCGVNDELRVLRDCGCYADFTLPSAPSPSQTRRINSIYYAADDPDRPKSHDDGAEVRAGGEPSGDLMIIQGPLGVRWTGGKFGVLPQLETGNLAMGGGATPGRVASWIRTRVCVAGRADWIFVKVHTHGCIERNWNALFGQPMRVLHTCLANRYNDGKRYKLHYVAAREMYNIIKAAERGLRGDPGTYRDLEIAPPPCAVEGRHGD